MAHPLSSNWHERFQSTAEIGSLSQWRQLAVHKQGAFPSTHPLSQCTLSKSESFVKELAAASITKLLGSSSSSITFDSATFFLAACPGASSISAHAA